MTSPLERALARIRPAAPKEYKPSREVEEVVAAAEAFFDAQKITLYNTLGKPMSLGIILFESPMGIIRYPDGDGEYRQTNIQFRSHKKELQIRLVRPTETIHFGSIESWYVTEAHFCIVGKTLINKEIVQGEFGIARDGALTVVESKRNS